MKTASKSFPSSSSVTEVDSTTGVSTTYTSQYDIFTVGAGYLNLAAALANTEVIPAGTAGRISPCEVRCDVPQRLYR